MRGALGFCVDVPKSPEKMNFVMKEEILVWV